MKEITSCPVLVFWSRSWRTHAYLQGYIQFINAIRFTTAKNILGTRVYLEAQKASNERARDYCFKASLYEEYGVFISTRNSSKGSRRESLSDAMQRLNRRECIRTVLEDHPDCIRDIQLMQCYTLCEREDKAKVLYFYGKTGKGKTFNVCRAVAAAGLSYFKKCPGHKWFDGYDKQDVLILEEFQSCFPANQFKSICDPRPPSLRLREDMSESPLPG